MVDLGNPGFEGAASPVIVVREKGERGCRLCFRERSSAEEEALDGLMACLLRLPAAVTLSSLAGEWQKMAAITAFGPAGMRGPIGIEGHRAWALVVGGLFVCKSLYSVNEARQRMKEAQDPMSKLNVVCKVRYDLL